MSWYIDGDTRAATKPPVPAAAADQRLITFLYVLLRDRLPAGQVEAIVVDHVEKARDRTCSYSNPYVEAYARELAERLTPTASIVGALGAEEELVPGTAGKPLAPVGPSNLTRVDVNAMLSALEHASAEVGRARARRMIAERKECMAECAVGVVRQGI